MTTLGAVMCSIAFLASSYVNKVELLYLTYGVLLGLGVSCFFTGTLLITAKYFTRWRSLALSLVSGGIGVGVLVYGPALTASLDAVGWKVTFRIMAGVMVLVVLLSLTFDENDELVRETRDINHVKVEVKTSEQEGDHCASRDENDKAGNIYNRSLPNTVVGYFKDVFSLARGID